MGERGRERWERESWDEGGEADGVDVSVSSQLSTITTEHGRPLKDPCFGQPHATRTGLLTKLTWRNMGVETVEVRAVVPL